MTTDVFVMSPETLKTLLRKERGIGILIGMATTALIFVVDKYQDEIKDKSEEIMNKIKNHKSKKEAMEEMSEKITNMTMNGASDEELEAAIRESKDVIDSYK